MLIVHWLGIGAGAILTLTLILCRRRIMISPLYLHSRYLFLRFLAYPLLIRRRYYSSITVLQAVVFVIYLAGNAVYLANPWPSYDEIANRFGTMAAINMIPLFLRHSNIIMHYLVLPLHVHLIAHHWIGRVCIVQGIVHLTLILKSRLDRGVYNFSGSLTGAFMVLLGICSIYKFRQRNWEFFQILHIVQALAGAGGLIWHLKSSNKLFLPIIGPGIWLLSMIPRIWNHFRRKSDFALVTKHYRKQRVAEREIQDLDVIQVDIELKSEISIGPGQYIYLKGHPFMISWWEPFSRHAEKNGKIEPEKAKTITLLIKPANGFTRRLANRSSLENISFDGPYGQNLGLEYYDNVFLVAKGIGIAGVLSYAKQFLLWKLYPTDDQRFITRKLDLYWELDDNSQEKWGAPFLTSLQTDNHLIWLLKIWCFFPETLATTPLLELTPKIEDFKYIFPCDGETLETTVKERATKASGRTIIVACGVSSFTHDVRSWARTTACRYNVVDFAEVEYRPYTAEPKREKRLIRRQRGLKISEPIR